MSDNNNNTNVLNRISATKTIHQLTNKFNRLALNKRNVKSPVMRKNNQNVKSPAMRKNNNSVNKLTNNFKRLALNSKKNVKISLFNVNSNSKQVYGSALRSPPNTLKNMRTSGNSSNSNSGSGSGRIYGAARRISPTKPKVTKPTVVKSINKIGATYRGFPGKKPTNKVNVNTILETYLERSVKYLPAHLDYWPSHCSLGVSIRPSFTYELLGVS